MLNPNSRDDSRSVKALDSAIAASLVPARFTIPELRATYAIVTGETQDPGNFRRRFQSMLPQLVARMLLSVSQVNDQVMVVLVLPVTTPLKSCVRLVITLAVVGEIVIVTPEDALLPHPMAPSAAARVSIAEYFHQLIPPLPQFLNIRPRMACLVASSDPWRLSGLPIFQSYISIPSLLFRQLKCPAHREPESAYRVEEISPLRIIKRIHDRRDNLTIPYVSGKISGKRRPIRVKAVCGYALVRIA